MTCPQCRGENPPRFRFCGHCGAALPLACSSCGAALPPGFRFCGQCGAQIDAGAPVPGEPAAATAPIPPPAPDLEQRRRVAILFADIVGSTALADWSDPETVYQVVTACLEGLGRIVTGAGGYVAKMLGDGLMALFGAPAAHGDDPARAARAGLRMQEWMREHGAATEARHGILLRIRIGINYGSVVAASLAAGERLMYDVVGDAANVAQRVESSAEPGTVCASEPFYRLTRGRFLYRERGSAQVKGKREPLQLFELLGEREEAAEWTVPLVGREAELEKLREAARLLLRGETALIGVTGAAGMGKTRLLEALAQEIADLGLLYLRGAAVEGERRAPLSLWRAWLTQLLPLDPGASCSGAAAAIRRVLAPSHRPWAGWLAAVALDPQQLLALDAEGRERVTRGALRVLLQHWRAEQPAVLLVDDAERLDSLSLELLDELAADDGPALLVVLAGRDAAVFPRRAAPRIQLEPLRPAESEALLAAALPAEVSPELRGRLVERAGGSPLLLEMMARAGREAAAAGTSPESALATVPDTLYGLVQAEVDSLPAPQRRILQSAAALGRNFAERWLAAVCGTVEASPPWQPSWHRHPACEAGGSSPPWQPLEARELLIEQRPPPARELAFRHGALQEVLYEGMLHKQRQAEHARIAPVLAAEAAARPQLAATAAWHWRQAGNQAEALIWCLHAADHAAALYAAAEARELYQEALELATSLSAWDRAARAATGLAEIAALRGEFSLALAEYRRAAAWLETRAGEEDRLFRAAAARGQARVLAQTGTPGAAAPLLEQALGWLDTASGKSDPSDQSDLSDQSEKSEIRRERVRCLTEQAHTLCDLGHLEAAAAAGREAMAQATALGWDSGAAAAGSALGRIYPLLGQWPAAEQELRRAAARSEAASDWQRAASCRINLGVGLQSAGRFTEAIAALEEALVGAARIGDAEKMALAHLNIGSVQLDRGDWPAAETALREAIGRFRRMEHSLGAAAALCNLADVLRLTGRLPEAEAALIEAGTIQERIDAPYLRAHLMRTRAELALALGAGECAVELAGAALDLARAAGHPAVAAASQLALGRALRTLGRHAEAIQELHAAAAGFGETTLDGARAQAELAAALAAAGEAERAGELYRAAVTAIERLDARPWLEWLPAIGGAPAST